MSESSFTLLRDIGSILLEENEEIRFSIDAYRGYRYVSVRRYIKSDLFAGATRDGVTLTPEILRALEPLLLSLPDTPAAVKDGAIGKFAKRPGICIVVGVSSFKGRRGLDLRQWQDGVGLTKKGIRIPLEKLPEVKGLLTKTKAALDEQPDDVF